MNLSRFKTVFPRRQSEEGMTAGEIQNPHLDSSPFFLEGGPSGVLLLHGFTATPVEVKLMGQYLHERGYTVSGPLLPGHGTTIEAINVCSWRDWVDHAARAYAELTARCTRVFVGGESLGGLLTLYLGSAYPEIAGLILYAPAHRGSDPGHRASAAAATPGPTATAACQAADHRLPRAAGYYPQAKRG
jgi:alpha-beta hydrolase superfamily lysophospholipase